MALPFLSVSVQVACEHDWHNSRLQECTNPPHYVTSYGPLTATSNLCHHLVNHHLDAWIKGCEDLNIEITAEDVRPFVDEHLCRQGKYHFGKSSEKTANNIPEFMDELFTDLTIDWIVADDQVIWCF